MADLASLDQLRVFLAVAERGSFSAAARSVGRVQSAVSHAIATLEQTLGVVLFDRTGRTPRLTEAGRRLLSEARLVVAQSRAFHRAAAELLAGTEASLRLVVDSLFPASVLVAALATIHREFPQTTVRVQWSLLDSALDRVRADEADFGVCNLAEGASDLLLARPLTDVVLQYVCAPGHVLAEVPPPQSMARLQASTQIVLSEGEHDVDADADDRGVLSPRTWRVADVHTKLSLLLAGVGWGALPRTMVEAHVRAGRLVRLQPTPWPDGHRIRLHAVTRADRPLGPAGRRLFEALCAAAE